MTDSPRPEARRTAPNRTPNGAGLARPVGVVAALLSLLLPLSLLPLGAGCKNGSDKGTAPREAPAGAVDLRIGNRTFHLSVAATEDTRQLGLMGVKSMPQDRGMIFVFRNEQLLSFFMKNTLIPLDIVYVNAAGNVVSIHRMEPLATDARGQWVTTPSDAPARYAIELNAGAAEAAGVKTGDHLDLPPQVKDPPDLE